MQYMLEEHKADMTDIDICNDDTVWSIRLHGREAGSAAELSSLLKAMVTLEDAPADLIARLSPHYAELCTRGRQLRAQLPSYLEQQRAAVVAHCPLPAVLRSVVAAYAATTPEDMWADVPLLIRNLSRRCQMRLRLRVALHVTFPCRSLPTTWS
jgi:plasmid stability protein